MRARTRVKRKAVGLTSLIDVIFLLLLFFMLASSFTRYQLVPVASGASGGGAAARPALIRVHSASRMDLNGVAVAGDDMQARFERIADGEGKTLAIWSGPEASVQDVTDVMIAARAAGLNAVMLTGND
ncbi:biopolymer transporter ExbD [Breoghania sp. L-A4]|uniref:biopolymer transporter ExbD n=1 Tax=Breoghania sp. L-A4 TaxID=2304600 RepID=UPI000E35D82F|nr:biopolymer transporter ExbD [Breoghania sp. L-A4]AXS41660.1 hypothetical protein D1F64_18725 [Breoghania sp. L-A4]